ncbi:hypothetical protein N7452_001452 [Penicillium brevicompactum]|uniref:BTB domain-containing protein n=1 Tax=Penicillium brevicompactum TaxID=5074 RepID=A0A9W9UP85_PENBR|nr:hypothetical protein N7452_001452 [Penicillium brevicompactum]
MDTPQPPQVRVDEPVQSTPVQSTDATSSTQTAQPAQPAQPAPTDGSVSVATNDVEMGGTLNATPQPDAPTSDVQEIAPVPAKKSSPINFIDALTTPFIEIIVGQGNNDNPLKAHQGLLVQSPKLAELIDGLAASDPRRIHLPDEDVDAVGHFVQFLYRGDYAIPESHTPDLSDADKSEENMLRHARIYTLAEKLGLPELKNLAHGKIHKIKGTPGAELAYARYVYTHTKDDDNAIRRPVASHWANQSHILRHEGKCSQAP